MSKYFDSTSRTASLALPDEILKAALSGEAVDALPRESMPAKVALSSVAPADRTEAVSGNDLQETNLTACRTIQLPLGKIARVQFQDTNSLEPAEESYRALRTRLLRLWSTQRLRSIAITSAVQGEGKTLTSLNFALCCAQLHEMRVLLVDADIRTCGLSRTVNALAGPGLADVLSGQCKPEDAIVATDRPNLYLLSGGALTMPAAELFANRRWQELMTWCNERFKLTLVDSPPVLNLSDAELIAGGCDGIVVVVRALYTKRQVLQKCAGEIDAKKLIGVIYNGVQRGTHHRYQNSHYVPNPNQD